MDLVEGTDVTGEMIALQVKGGISYRRGQSYAVPCSAADRELWRTSSVPVFGVVHDPETDKLHWTNLTAWARSLLPDRQPARPLLTQRGLWTLGGCLIS